MTKNNKEIKNWKEKLDNPSLKTKISYWLYSPVRIASDIKLKIKWAWQRVFRGWDDTAYWDIEGWLAKIMSQIIRYQIKKGTTYPIDLTLKQWNDIRKKMIKGFEAIDKLDDLGVEFEIGSKTHQKLKREKEEGLKLFIEWLDALWD